MTLASRIKIGMALPQIFLDSPVNTGLVARVARRAEALGFEGL